MYLDYYGFSEKPFELSPDLKFLFLTPGHRESLGTILGGIETGKGLIVLTGEVGTGKTILIHGLLRRLPEKTKTALIFHPTYKFKELLEEIFNELGETGIKGGIGGLKDHLVSYLNGLKERGEILVVFIDEAQKLSGEVVKELFSLFEWEAWIPKVFQLVLVGQPELDTLVDNALMRYRPKVPGLRVKISPLSEKESLEYIAHRLRIAGSSAAAVFSTQALSLIAKYAHGIPRVINTVCDNAFLAGYSESLKRIEVGVIREIIGNLDGPGVKRKMRGRIFGAKASFRPLSLLTSRFGLIVLAGLAVGVFLYLAGPDLANQIIPSNGPGEIKKTAERRDPPAELRPSPSPAQTGKREGLTTTPDIDTNATQGGSQEGGDPRSGESIFQTIKVTKGQTLSKLAIQYYGKSNESLVDLILARNPSITDADLILVDQEIHFPELKEETLLAPAPEKTIRVHLGTFSSLNKATLFKNSLILRGHRIAVQPKKVSPRVTWYRVEATDYRTENEALADIKMLRGKRLLAFF